MEVLNALRTNRHENLLYFQHRDSGLKGVLAIHDSSLGPAVGGVRCWNYASEDALVTDAIRLAESASLSSALFGCDVGGGKAVIWCDPRSLNETMLRALGIFIHGLGGRFIASAELGTNYQDMETIGKETRFVTGVFKGNGVSEDYSTITARGVLHGMKAAAKVAFGTSSLEGRKIAVQGLGKVGTALIDSLVREGAQLFVSDLYFERVKNVKDKNPEMVMVPPPEIPFLPVDIFAPCALGDVLSTEVIPQLQCKIVAGAATNQLATERVAEELADAGIIYVPDFLLNAGDIVMVNAEVYGIPQESCLPTVERVYGLVEKLLLKAAHDKQTPFAIAKEWALDRMKSIRTLKKLYRVKRGGYAS